MFRFFLSSSLNEGLFVYSMFVMPVEFWYMCVLVDVCLLPILARRRLYLSLFLLCFKF